MREKSKPYRSLPFAVILWESLVHPFPKRRLWNQWSTQATQKKVAKELAYHANYEESLHSDYIDDSCEGLQDREHLAHSDNDSNSMDNVDDKDIQLTDLQKHMIRILKAHGGSASLETFVCQIQKIWGTLRKRDGTQYASDCRRVVSATLSNTSLSSPLFVRDSNKEKDSIGGMWWTFGPRALSVDLETILESDRLEISETKRKSVDMDDSDQSDRENIPLGVAHKRRKLSVDKQDSKDDNDSPLSPVQIAVIQAINQNGGAAQLTTIHKFLSKRWRNLRQKDLTMKTGDCKQAVKETLLSYSFGGEQAEDSNSDCYGSDISLPSNSSSSDVAVQITRPHRLFTKDTEKEGYWRLTPHAAALYATISKSSPSKSPKAEPESEPQPSSPKVKQEDQSGEVTTDNFPKLTNMQDMLMRIIVGKGGFATFDQIKDDVIQNWKSVCEWDSRSKRALLASLSHNPPGNFKKTKDGMWTLSPKGLGLLMGAQHPMALDIKQKIALSV